jgi:FlaA1/EpsC-like NDP-sugar epimerase
MSIPEAAQLVLQAASMGGAGQIFVLEMGEPIRIVDLARDIIRLSGLNDEQVKIEYTGLRPGEKLFEEVMDRREQLLDTPHPKLRVALARGVSTHQTTAALRQLCASPPANDDATRELLRQWVPEYLHTLADLCKAHASLGSVPEHRTEVRV